MMRLFAGGARAGLGCLAFALLLSPAALAQAPAPPPAQPAPAAPTATPPLAPKIREGLGLQVALDRAAFSPGEIDGRGGPNTRASLAAFQGSKGLQPTGSLDAATRAALGEAFAQPITNYTITPEDVAGPFAPSIPADLMEQATLEALSYTSPLELLAERFHASPRLLQQLNPVAKFVAGETIVVPDVEPFYPPAEKGKRKQPAAPVPTEAGGQMSPTTPAQKGAPVQKTAQAHGAKASGGKGAGSDAAAPPPPPEARIIVEKNGHLLRVERNDGSIAFAAPVTFGSENDPLPIGDWKVTGVYLNPVFHYNPDLFWDADPSHAKAKVPPGPNNPVGPVWIDISKEHYGFHGTPEPSRVGHTQSHGCVRLTNWDAMRLAALVDEGTPVVFR